MPMVDGVQPNSLAQAAAATLKLVRSAHNRTLPTKKTMTVTGQLIGRPCEPSRFADMAFLPDFYVLCLSHGSPPALGFSCSMIRGVL
jgi:hypothetical protein